MVMYVVVVNDNIMGNFIFIHYIFDYIIHIGYNRYYAVKKDTLEIAILELALMLPINPIC